jgi:hypothetical protein
MSDNNYEIKDYNVEKILKKRLFKNEKEFTKFIKINIEIICKDLLEDIFLSFKENTYLSHFKGFSNNKPRIDLIIRCKKNTYGVEIKNPTFKFSELSKSISQLLAYQIIAKRNNFKIDRYILMLSDYDKIITDIIIEFKLPIDVIVIQKDFSLIWKYDKNKIYYEKVNK